MEFDTETGNENLKLRIIIESIARQPGSQAAKQPGSQAARQPSSQTGARRRRRRRRRRCPRRRRHQILPDP